MAEIEGGCLCGNIRFRAKGTPGFPQTCYGTVCRSHNGALTASWVEFPRKDVEWTGPGGPPATWRSSEKSSCAFCPVCGSSIGAIDDAPVIPLLTGALDRT